MQPKYAFYATLLDAFAWYKKSESEEAQQEFLDKVNRVKVEPTEAMLRGTAFNNLVDTLIAGAPGEGVFGVDRDEDAWIIHGKRCNFSVVDKYVERFRGALSQLYVETLVPTRCGEVKVYGFIDELLGDMAWEIKTTERYEFPKYLHHWQHPVYLQCLKDGGAPQVNRFTYMATDFREIYEEEYLYRSEDTDRLIAECCHLVEFLEEKRPQITDTRVFGAERDKVTR